MEDNNGKMETSDPSPEREHVAELEREIDERDETIRLLNEALSDALDEIERLAPRRAA